MHMGARRQSRELALQFLYSQDFQQRFDQPEKVDVEPLSSIFLQLVDDQEKETAREIMRSHDEQAVIQLQILFRLADEEENITGFQVAPVRKKNAPEPVPQDRAKFFAKIVPYAQQLVQGLLPLLPEIDRSISRHSHNWRLERMSLVDRNILRLALYEMLHEDEVPAQVAINEALEIAKRYSVEDSVSFINGILDSVRTKGTDLSPA